MNKSKCTCGACTSFKNQEPFCDGCDEICCVSCAEARGAYDELELLCKGCDEFSCLRCADERKYPYAGKLQVIQALESTDTARQILQQFIKKSNI